MRTVDLTADVLVVGGGAAGSRAAYEAKKAHPELRVALIMAGRHGSSGSTNLMASESLGMNAPFNYMEDGDSSDLFYRDMLDTGAGLSDPRLCRVIADEACRRVEELRALGMRLDAEAGRPVQRKLSGCTRARSLTLGGSTGREIVDVLRAGMCKRGVEVIEDARALDLIRDETGRVRGAAVWARGNLSLIGAKAVVLATGGAGRIFQRSVNPPYLEGDGWCMAYRAGARLVNMEFFQIGPAVLRPRLTFIIHSHMWRLRPRLTNGLGEAFLARYCPAGTDPEEVMALKAMSYPFSVRTASKYLDIGIFKEAMAGRGTPAGGVAFDVSHIPIETLVQRAPITYETLKRAGADLSREPIEIGMAVQNFNGGIWIDAEGWTGVEGLYAAGEVSGGVHGADRPGGNNLIDTQVFGYRAGRAAAESARRSPAERVEADVEDARYAPPSREDEALIAESAERYYRHLTVVRTRAGLKSVLDFAGAGCLHHRNVFLENRLLLGSLLATASLMREESRGTHYRDDFPETSHAWARRIFLFQQKDGGIGLEMADAVAEEGLEPSGRAISGGPITAGRRSSEDTQRSSSPTPS